MLNLKQAAERLGMSEQYLRTQAKRFQLERAAGYLNPGGIPSTRQIDPVSGIERTMFAEQDVDAYGARSKTRPTGANAVDGRRTRRVRLSEAEEAQILAALPHLVFTAGNNNQKRKAKKAGAFETAVESIEA